MLPELLSRLAALLGEPYLLTDPESRTAYGTDALKRGHDADAVVLPSNAEEVAGVVRLCTQYRVPFVPRGGGTGFTGGAVPVHGGIVISMERMNGILEIDERNLVAVVEPNVITGDLQDAVEKVGLFYPPDPSSLRQSVVGGNVAECAGGPRAFKYGTTKNYVLGLQAVLPTGEIVRTGGKVVKNVVGYDLTHLLVGSEGTLAIITQIVLRLVPRPPAQITIRADFDTIEAAVSAVSEIVRNRVVPATLELVDRECLDAVATYLRMPSLAPPDSAAVLIVEVDGTPAAAGEDAMRVENACAQSAASRVVRARDDTERRQLWSVRRELSPSLLTIAPLKFNHDVVVPKARIPELFALVDRLRAGYRLRIPCFGHAGDGNIHVNIMASPDVDGEVQRAHEAEKALFAGVVALEGSISGEHGIGFSKAPFISIELSPDEIALMKRVKAAFDPHNLLNPGKIFPS